MLADVGSRGAQADPQGRRHQRLAARRGQVTGTSSATATATRPVWPSPTSRGQYGGTAEKEKTRDTYHGFVFPEVTYAARRGLRRTPTWAARNAQLKEAQEKIWALWPAMWAWTPNNLLAKRKRVTALELSRRQLLRPRLRVGRLGLIGPTQVIPC